MPSNKEKYKELCQYEQSIPLFMKHHWLEGMVNEGQWDVILEENGSEIIGALPYFIKKKSGFTLITMPKLTPYMGIWLKYPKNQKYTNRLGFENKIYANLISKLPPFDRMVQNLHYEINNWLPYFWQSFKQTTRYTYILNDLSNTGTLFSDFRENIRREIRKAEKSLKIECGFDTETFFRLQKSIFHHKHMKIPFSAEHLNRLDETCKQANCGKAFFARDENNQVHASIYIVWDENTCYYLLGGANPEFRTSGAMSLLLWEAIQFASKQAGKFNFEGSMIEPVERFFRAFGAIQTPYFQIKKTNSFVIRCNEALSGLLNKN